MSGYDLFSKEELAFFCKAIESAAGNAATAISQMTKTDVRVSLASARFVGGERIDTVIGEPDMAVVAVRMALYGGVNGQSFFLVPEKDSSQLVALLREAVFGNASEGQEPLSRQEYLSVLEETGNIVAGAYLTRLHDIVGLNIYHGIPELKVDMYLSLLDESFAREIRRSNLALFLENKFRAREKDITTFFLLVPVTESVEVLSEAVKRVITSHG